MKLEEITEGATSDELYEAAQAVAQFSVLARKILLNLSVEVATQEIESFRKLFEDCAQAAGLSIANDAGFFSEKETQRAWTVALAIKDNLIKQDSK